MLLPHPNELHAAWWPGRWPKTRGGGAEESSGLGSATGESENKWPGLIEALDELIHPENSGKFGVAHVSDVQVDGQAGHQVEAPELQDHR